MSRKTERETPPVAVRAPHATEIHGETLVDPYFWLRDREAEAVTTYLEAENAYTKGFMRHTEGLQARLYDEMVGRIQETDLSVPVRRGPYFYFSRTEEGRQYPIFARKRGSLDAPEEILLDVNALAEGRGYCRIGLCEISPDHSLLAYAYDANGSEDYTLRFKDLERGVLLDDSIRDIGYGFAWGNDGQTVFYTRRDEAHRPDRVLRHVLGAPTEDDVVVYEDPDDRFYVSVHKTRSDGYIVIESGSSVTSEQWLLDADLPGGEFTVVRERVQGVEYAIDHHGDFLYIRTNEQAKNFCLIRVPTENFAGPAEVLVEHRAQVTLERVLLFARHMVLLEREAGLRRLSIRDLEAAAELPVSLPEAVYGLEVDENPSFDTSRFRFQYTSPVTPRTVYDVDMDSGELSLLKRDEILGDYDPSRYETRRLFARARDGVAVPVVLLHRRGLPLDGTAPCLLYGYGSYGHALEPSFSSTRLSLVDRGFVFAVANVRGGGTLGEEWHDHGKMLEKVNTFHDFIDVASFLIEQQYTRPERLAIQGGSAGGLLVGAVVNMRPDLFHVAIAQVPFVDVLNTMLDESIPLTVGEFEEWGNPKERDFFEAIRAYSPYDNIQAQEYPHMLITAGLNDPRVQYWEPAKWTAKLRATKVGDQRLLLKTNMGAGHGGASGRYDSLKELAFVYAFLLDTLGVEGRATEVPSLETAAADEGSAASGDASLDGVATSPSMLGGEALDAVALDAVALDAVALDAVALDAVALEDAPSRSSKQ